MFGSLHIRSRVREQARTFTEEMPPQPMPSHVSRKDTQALVQSFHRQRQDMEAF
jgi:hypothetical protein